MKPAYFGQCSRRMNIDTNDYTEETGLHTNPSLTLAQILTLSTTTPRFLILHTWIHQTILGGIQSLYQKSISEE